MKKQAERTLQLANENKLFLLTFQLFFREIAVKFFFFFCIYVHGK